MSRFDEQIKSSTHQNMAKSLVVGTVVGCLGVAFLLWLFLVKGNVLLISPADAKAQTIEVNKGVAIALGSRLYRIGDQAQITVDADKYEPSQVVINNGSPAVVEILLHPSPAELVLKTSPVDSDTLWLVNNEAVHIGAELNHKVEPGNIDIRVESRYHTPATASVELDNGDLYEDTFKLETIKGSFSVESRPSGASVTLDGAGIGVTPLQLDLEGGQYDLVLNKSGFEPTTELLEIYNKEPEAERNYILTPVSASLMIDVSPKGGVLVVNGKTRKPGKNTVVAGSLNDVIYELEGYYPFKKTVSVAEGHSKSLSIALEPEYGDIVVSSNLAADIYVDGKFVATGSYTGSVQAFTYQVEFVKEGYRTVARALKPTSKQPSKLHVEMLTEFEARKREGRKLFSETLGIKMIKLRGNEFTMGSLPNESGRRRNEHQIQVGFTRQFWLSAHEITEAQFAAYMGQSATSNYPKTDTTWDQAALFCNWLSVKEGLTPFYNANGSKVIGFNPSSKGYRLPTEAEWEWAAKKSLRSKSTVFVWGNATKVPAKAGNFGDQSIAGTQAFVLKSYNDGYAGAAPVGSFKADKLGLYDMAGNVSEWVHDYFTFLPPNGGTVHKDYMGPASGDMQAWKGGSFKSGKLSELRTSFRESSNKADTAVGFRVARYED